MITISNDMKTGVSKIDEQHMELVNRINNVTSMGMKSLSKEETQKTLNLLGEYIIKHFNDEEALQKASGYPKFESHKKLHQQYIFEFQKLKNEFNTNGVSPAFTLSLSNSIIGWIVRHIKTVDVEFGKYFIEHSKK
ncbi:MAG: hemerythrin family protein [Oscillospiraceae bacterium]|jgi:hemerythrin|nr:hemerythrin family protein [Oscillospiraceae bacterium]